jgi:ABC-2 type transport system ATP-binding protein
LDDNAYRETDEFSPMDERTDAIETTALTKRYGATTALADLDLRIERGSVYGFLGPNGAGKSTTIRILTTLIDPSSGTARVAGHPVTDRDAVGPQIGYLPEEPPLYEELTGREQIDYIARLRDLAGPERGERIDALLERFDLAEDADARISTYSKGMKQKTSLIQALVHDPAVVFLDEPTSGLDPRAARTVRETITELADEEITVFLSTHILPVVDRVADTVGVLADGRLVAEDSPDALKERLETGSETTLEDVFLDVTEREPYRGAEQPTTS